MILLHLFLYDLIFSILLHIVNHLHELLAQFISLLQDLEANLRVMDVTHLSLTANDSGTYDWSVELKTYWLRSQ